MGLLLFGLALVFGLIAVSIVAVWLLITLVEAIFGTDRNSDLLE